MLQFLGTFNLTNNALLNIGLNMRKPVFGSWGKHGRRPACASAQSDQRLLLFAFGKAPYVNFLQAKFQFSS